MELTKEQQKLFDDTEKLIWFIITKKFCISKRPDIELIADMCRTALVNAILFFDKTKGRFTTYACHCIANKIYKYLSKDKRHNLGGVDCRYIEGDDDIPVIEDPCVFEETYTENDYEQYIISCAYLKLMDLPRKQQDIYNNYLLCGNMTTVAKKFNVSRQYVRKVITKANNLISIDKLDPQYNIV